ncbi:MAG: serine hydrolase [Candidatus Paceibacterota bacterium]|jgi:D-alanyl-D-alanine carboxypeptidase
MIENEEKKQPQIHLKTDIDVFGKKTVTIKNSKVRSKKYVFVATVLAVLIGVSVPYFLVDAGSKLYEKVSVKYLGSSVVATKIDSVALGSDDENNFDIPAGREVLINDGPDMAEGQYYFQSPDYIVPKTSADAYIVADVDTGEIIIEKNPEKIHPIASISKIITAIVARERMNQHDTVTVSRSSINIYGTAGGLRSGEKILVTDLYYPLLMESSNDAADVFAEGYGYDKFISHMNAKAKEIGMTATSFFEPSGLSEKNVSTAADLFKLAQYVTERYPEIWDISRVRQYAILGHSWSNGSVLARRADFIGGKNGFTYEANQTAIVILNVKMEGGPRRIAITLLQSGSRENDASLLQRFVSKWVGFLPVGQSLNEN